MALLNISVTILTKNSQKHITEVLKALEAFDEVLVCDTGSTDDTITLALRFPNVTIKSCPFIGFGPTHNAATALARHDWILSIDSDEVASAKMIQSIQETALEADTVYTFPRDNYYRGKWIRWCGWYPDRQVRLYHRKKTLFTDAQVHEGIITSGLKVLNLNGSMKHYSYESVADFLNKMQSYSSLFAKQNQHRKSSSLCKAIAHGLFSFFKSYILKRGFLGGSEGFEISIYNGNTAFYKYLKLAEVNRQPAEKSAGVPTKKPASEAPPNSSMKALGQGQVLDRKKERD
jgi:glycosyltransferase involved in cell wall biosynthesis